MQTQCMWYQHVTKSHTLIHQHPDTVIIDSSTITRTRIQPNHPSSPGYGYRQYKSNSTQWELTSPECICTHNTSMQHSINLWIHQIIINWIQNQDMISSTIMHTISSINMHSIHKILIQSMPQAHYCIYTEYALNNNHLNWKFDTFSK